MKIYVSVDMEGIGGVTRAVQVQPGTPEYAEARQWAAEEIVACLAGAREAGATEFWVKDAHGSGFNLPWTVFPEDTRLVTGSTGSVRFPGLDQTFAALFLIGYHAMAGTKAAVLQHTWSSRDLTRFFFNGQEVGEIAFDAAIAGAFGVPVALVSGDDKTEAEARATLGAVKTVVVKEGVTREGAILCSRAQALARMKGGGKEAVESIRAREIAPYCPSLPLLFRMEWTSAHGLNERREASGIDIRAVLCEVIGQS